MSGSVGTPTGRGENTFHQGLKALSTAWTDTEMIAVRKMAALGMSCADIGLAVGKSDQWVRNFIHRNKLVWNKKRGGGPRQP